MRHVLIRGWYYLMSYQLLVPRRYWHEAGTWETLRASNVSSKPSPRMWEWAPTRSTLVKSLLCVTFNSAISATARRSVFQCRIRVYLRQRDVKSITTTFKVTHPKFEEVVVVVVQENHDRKRRFERNLENSRSWRKNGMMRRRRNPKWKKFGTIYNKQDARCRNCKAKSLLKGTQTNWNC